MLNNYWVFATLFLLDGVLTIIAISNGAFEANPLVRLVIKLLKGPLGIIAFKALALIGIYFMRIELAWMNVFVYANVIMMVVNIYTIYVIWVLVK